MEDSLRKSSIALPHSRLILVKGLAAHRQERHKDGLAA